MSRRCYGWEGAKSDVYFAQRTTTGVAAGAAFGVKDFETIMWSTHAAVIGSDPTITDDKYNDNHYAIDARSVSSCKRRPNIELRHGALALPDH